MTRHISKFSLTRQKTRPIMDYEWIASKISKKTCDTREQ